jgi:hypothetical protein
VEWKSETKGGGRCPSSLGPGLSIVCRNISQVLISIGSLSDDLVPAAKAGEGKPMEIFQSP